MPLTGPLDLETAEQPTPVELHALKRVFNWIDTDKDGKLSLHEITAALSSLGHKMPKCRTKNSLDFAHKKWIWAPRACCLHNNYVFIDDEVTHSTNTYEFVFLVFCDRELPSMFSQHELEIVIWEVDEDLDQHISWSEFLVMYQRGINDFTGLEPRKFFSLVQFLMYDTNFSGEISVEQTLQILFVRYGREMLDQEIQAIFGEEEKGPEGQEKRITLTEYLERAQGRLNKQRKAKKGVNYPRLHVHK